MRTDRCKICGIELGFYVNESEAYCSSHNLNQTKLFGNQDEVNNN